MAEESDYRGWDDLIPDALGLIFSNLSLREVLMVVPRVCKSWHKAVMGPYCWQEIDIEEWSSQWPEHLEKMLQLLIVRSCGSLRKLCVSGLRNDAVYSLIAEHAGSLQTLRLRRGEMSDLIVEQIAGRLSTVTLLDLSYCNNIGARALEAIGKHCKSLVELCRNMHPLDMAGKQAQDDEAYAIATTMPQLKHLELAYHLISTASVVKIISSCPKLELLDLRGCWNVKLDDEFLSKSFPKLKVLGPIVVGYYERMNWDACSDFSDSSESLAWGIDYESSDGVYEDDYDHMGQQHMGFFEEFVNHAGYEYWPPSP